VYASFFARIVVDNTRAKAQEFFGEELRKHPWVRDDKSLDISVLLDRVLYHFLPIAFRSEARRKVRRQDVDSAPEATAAHAAVSGEALNAVLVSMFDEETIHMPVFVSTSLAINGNGAVEYESPTDRSRMDMKVTWHVSQSVSQQFVIEMKALRGAVRDSLSDVLAAIRQVVVYSTRLPAAQTWPPEEPVEDSARMVDTDGAVGGHLGSEDLAASVSLSGGRAAGGRLLPEEVEVDSNWDFAPDQGLLAQCSAAVFILDFQTTHPFLIVLASGREVRSNQDADGVRGIRCVAMARVPGHIAPVPVLVRIAHQGLVRGDRDAVGVDLATESAGKRPPRAGSKRRRS
jgi:hypothetical protein